jgi:hypothetical protein
MLGAASTIEDGRAEGRAARGGAARSLPDLEVQQRRPSDEPQRPE